MPHSRTMSDGWRISLVSRLQSWRSGGLLFPQCLHVGAFLASIWKSFWILVSRRGNSGNDLHLEGSSHRRGTQQGMTTARQRLASLPLCTLGHREIILHRTFSKAPFHSRLEPQKAFLLSCDPGDFVFARTRCLRATIADCPVETMPVGNQGGIARIASERQTCLCEAPD